MTALILAKRTERKEMCRTGKEKVKENPDESLVSGYCGEEA